MQRIDGPTVSAALPAPQATGTGGSAPGYFGRGNVATGTPATTLDPDWANMIQEEIAGVVTHAGIALDKTNHGQLLAALLQTFVSSGSSGGVTIVSGEITIPLPGGFFLKIGQVAIGSGSNVVNGQITFATAFPNNCFFVSGNSDSPANPNWHPVVIMIATPTAQGAPFIADSANVNQAINAGRTLRWIAIGN